MAKKEPRYRAETYGKYFREGYLIVKRSELATIIMAEREFMKLYVQEHGWWNKVKRGLMALFVKKTRVIPAAKVTEDTGSGPAKMTVIPGGKRTAKIPEEPARTEAPAE